jgi:hypothetical protein
MGRYDWVALAGLALIAAGMYLIYPPAALLTFGAGLVLFGMAGARGEMK